MLRTRASFAFAALILPAFLAAQPEPALWRFVQPNAKVLIGIDWARIRQSPAGTMIREKWIPQNAVTSFPELELLDSADRFLISLPGKFAPGEDPHADDPTDSSDTPVLIAIHGHFDEAHVRELFQRMGAKRQSYESFQVYRPQSKKERDMAYVLFDQETILYGFAPSVFAALDHNRFAPPAAGSVSPGSMAARAAALEAKYEIWAILDAAQTMSNDPIADLFGANEWAAVSQGFEAGLNLRNGLDADFIVHFSSEDAAKRVAGELTSAVAQAAKDKHSGGDMAYLARKLKFNVEGSSTRVNMHLSEQDLEKTAQALAQSFKSGEAQAANAASSENQPPASAPVPSKRGVIRIEGLDDGPREIPYPNPQQ